MAFPSTCGSRCGPPAISRTAAATTSGRWRGSRRARAWSRPGRRLATIADNLARQYPETNKDMGVTVRRLRDYVVGERAPGVAHAAGSGGPGAAADLRQRRQPPAFAGGGAPAGDGGAPRPGCGPRAPRPADPDGEPAARLRRGPRRASRSPMAGTRLLVRFGPASIPRLERDLDRRAGRCSSRPRCPWASGSSSASLPRSWARARVAAERAQGGGRACLGRAGRAPGPPGSRDRAAGAGRDAAHRRRTAGAQLRAGGGPRPRLPRAPRDLRRRGPSPVPLRRARQAGRLLRGGAASPRGPAGGRLRGGHQLASPTGINDQGGFAVEGLPDPLPGEDGPQANRPRVSAGYFDTMGIRLLEGRLFDERDRAGAPPVAVVSDAGRADLLAGREPSRQAPGRGLGRRTARVARDRGRRGEHAPLRPGGAAEARGLPAAYPGPVAVHDAGRAHAGRSLGPRPRDPCPDRPHGSGAGGASASGRWRSCSRSPARAAASRPRS